jgi:hypothetical protein
MCRHPGVFYRSAGLSTFRDGWREGISRDRFQGACVDTLTVRGIPGGNSASMTDLGEESAKSACGRYDSTLCLN